MKNQKIAYVHYPHNVNPGLETMSFSLNSVICLAKMGFNVDLYLWEEASQNYKNFFPETVVIKSFRHPEISLNSRLNLLRIVSLQFQFKWRKNTYDCVFGLGQIGAYIGNIIAVANQCPFIYLNDEFPSCWGNDNPWAKCERQAVENAALVVVPDLVTDLRRYYHLSKELNISNKPFAALPNIPLLQSSFEEINWHKKLDINSSLIPFLHAGSVSEWAQIPEILSSIPYWHENAVLIIHGHSRESLERYRKELSHLDIPEKVIWSCEPLTLSQLNSLVSYCAGNFALYRNTNPNFEYVGFSSGRLMRSLVCGSPVIAPRLSSLSYVEDNQLGILINHPAEIPNAVRKIIDEREEYSQRCLDFCRSHASFEKAWLDFSTQLQEIIGVDLEKDEKIKQGN